MMFSLRSFSIYVVLTATCVQSLKPNHNLQVQRQQRWQQSQLNSFNKLQSNVQTILKPIIISLSSACIVSTTTPSDIILAAVTAAPLTAVDSTKTVIANEKPSDGRRTMIKLPSGVEYYDATIGSGNDIVKEGSSVQFQWVLRRSNGYFVDASSNYDSEPFIYKVGNTKKIIKGLDEAIRGMKLNGVRQINVPPAVAYIEGVGDDKPGPMPAGFGPRRQITTRQDREVWYFEIKVTKIKNN